MGFYIVGGVWRLYIEFGLFFFTQGGLFIIAYRGDSVGACAGICTHKYTLYHSGPKHRDVM